MIKSLKSFFFDVKYQVKMSSPEYLSRIIPSLLFLGLLIYLLGPMNVFLTFIPILIAFFIGVVISLV
jgi:hypothetical protein